MSNQSTINIDDLTPIGSNVDPGRYKARLIGCEGKLSKAQKPMITPEYEIISGESNDGNDQSGKSITLYHSLSVTEKTNAKTGALQKFGGGLVDIKKTFIAVGKPLPAGFGFPNTDAAAAAALYTKRLAGLVVDLLVVREKDSKDESKTRTRAQVVGLAHKAVAASDVEESYE